MWKQALLGALTVASVAGARVQVRDSFQASLQEAPQALKIEVSSGQVRVQGVPGGRTTIEGRYRVHAGTQARAKELAEKLRQRPPMLREGTTLTLGKLDGYGFGNNEGVSLDFDVRLPPAVAVTVDATSGEVKVQEVKGPVKVDLTSGDVQVSKVQEEVTIEATSGDVQLFELAGKVTVESTSGDVKVEKVQGDVTVEATSGSVTVVDPAQHAELEVSSGNVKLSGRPGDGARWKVEASSGDVTVKVPESAPMRFAASTSSGSIRSDLPVTQSGQLSKRRLEGTLAATTSSTLDVSTSSGDIRLEKL